jgi:hypothetical protein
MSFTAGRNRGRPPVAYSAAPAPSPGPATASSTGSMMIGAGTPPVLAPAVVARTFSSAAADAISSLRFLASAFPAGSEGPRLPRFDVSTAAAVAATTSVTSASGPRRAVPTTARPPLAARPADATAAAAAAVGNPTSVTATFVLKVTLSALFLGAVWGLAQLGFLPSWDTVWPVLACWLPVEVCWSIYFRVRGRRRKNLRSLARARSRARTVPAVCL